MLTVMKHVSHLEQKLDDLMERFLFRHRVWGFFMMFIAIPMITLAAVCAGATVMIFPVALVCGWI